MHKKEMFIFLDKKKWFGLRKIYYLFKSLVHSIKEKLIDFKIIYPSYEQVLIKRLISRKLIEKYSGDEGQNVNFNQFFLGFGLIHYAFIRNIKPKNILCIGSRKGYIPAIMALACKDNAEGHVDFIDAGYDANCIGKNWSGIGFWKKNNPTKHFAKIGVQEYISTFVMTSDKFSKKFPKKHYQYIYIDGDHSYEGVKLDYELFWPKLDSGGFISFHDVVAKGYLDKGLFGVWKFWKEISDKNAIIFPFPEDSGLGIIQKK